MGFSVRDRHDIIHGPGGSTHHIIEKTHKWLKSLHLHEISEEYNDELKAKLVNFFAVEEMGIRCDPQRIKCMCRGC